MSGVVDQLFRFNCEILTSRFQPAGFCSTTMRGCRATMRLKAFMTPRTLSAQAFATVSSQAKFLMVMQEMSFRFSVLQAASA